MNIAMFFFFFVSIVLVVGICWAVYDCSGKYQKGMVFGIHIPEEYAKSEEIRQICGRFHKRWNLFQGLSMLSGCLLCGICLLGFEVFIIIWMVWIFCYIVILLVMTSLPMRAIYRAKEAAYPGLSEADGDVYWKNGWYANPEDSRILIPNRMSDMNYSFNLGRPTGKVLVGLISATTVGVCVWVISMMLGFAIGGVTFTMEQDHVSIKAAGYSCTFDRAEIQSVELLDAMPDDSFARTNGGSTDTYNIGHFRSRTTGEKCMMFLYKKSTPILKVTLAAQVVYANSQKAEETRAWYEALSQP